MEEAVRDVSIGTVARVILEFAVAPAWIIIDGIAAVADVKRPLGQIDAGAVEFVAPNKRQGLSLCHATENPTQKERDTQKKWEHPLDVNQATNEKPKRFQGIVT